MVQIKQNIVVHNQPVVGVAPWRGIHAHSTGNTAPAVNEIAYLGRKTLTEAGLESGFYTHIVDGQTGEITQVGKVGQGAWDIGAPANYNTYAAIELTETATTADEFKKGYTAYIEVLVYLAKQAGVAITVDTQNSPDDPGIMTHAYSNEHGWGTTHVDPYPYLAKWGVSRAKFAQDIAAHANGGDVTVEPVKQPAPTPSKPSSAINQFKQAGNKFTAFGEFTVDEMKFVNGIWQGVNYALAGGRNVDWTNNGIPLDILDNVTRGNVNPTQVGDKVKFGKSYASGTIDQYDQATNAVGINYYGYGLIWFNANAFIKL
jgi:N-acetylmuramoyl-L-alanine amidase.